MGWTKEEKRQFLVAWSLTVLIFAIAASIQFGVVIGDFKPLHIALPVILSNILGAIIGWNRVLAFRLRKAMADKNRLYSSVSHEFRTPLNAITGFSQLLLLEDKIKSDPRLSDPVNEILSASNHFLTLVNDILDLAQLESGKLTVGASRVRITKVVQEVVSISQPLFRQRDLLLFHEIDCDCAVTADYTRLKQILLNLVANAVKFNRDGGNVSIRCIALPENWTRIEVTDSGYGVDEKESNRIFQIFERSDRLPDIVEGSGIGLSLSRDLALLMGGRLGFDNNNDVGATFWVDLPTVN